MTNRNTSRDLALFSVKYSRVFKNLPQLAL